MTRTQQIGLISLNLLVLIAIFLFGHSEQWFSQRFLWDFEVYTRAINDLQLDHNPYRTDILLAFVYHPYILHTFNFIQQWIPLSVFLVSGYAFSVIFFTYQLRPWLRTLPSINPYISSLFLVMALCFGWAGLIAIATGNITTYLHLLLLGLFMRAWRHKSLKTYLLFASVIALCAIAKPYLLAYSLLFFYLRPIKYSMISMVAVLCTWGILWFSVLGVYPQQYHDFLMALNHQMSTYQDYGYSVFGLISNFSTKSWGLVIHIGSMGLLGLGLLMLGRIRYQSWNSPELLPLVIAWITLLNPRMKEYDFVIAVLATLFFAIKQQGVRALWSIIVAGFLSIQAFILMALHYDLGWQVPGQLARPGEFQLIGLALIITTSLLAQPTRHDASDKSYPLGH